MSDSDTTVDPDSETVQQESHSEDLRAWLEPSGAGNGDGIAPMVQFVLPPGAGCADCPRRLVGGGFRCLVCKRRVCLECTSWILGERRELTVCEVCVADFGRIPDDRSRTIWLLGVLNLLQAELNIWLVTSQAADH